MRCRPDPLTENERQFIAELARAADDVDTAALWEECGCSMQGVSESTGLKRRIAAFLRRSDVQSLLDIHQRRWRLERWEAARENARGEWQKEKALNSLERIALEVLQDTLLLEHAALANGERRSAAGMAALQEKVQNVVRRKGSAMGALTPEQRQALLAKAAQARKTNAEPTAEPEAEQSDEGEPARQEKTVPVDVKYALVGEKTEGVA